MSTTRRPVVLLVQPSRDDGLEMYTEFLRYHRLAVIPVSDSAASPALDPSSLKSAPLARSANVTEYDIARRAYELYLARDGEDGHDVDDWLQAEQELQRARGASMNRDELEGKAEALKGKIKQAAGTITRDPDLHDEGVVDEVAGRTQAAIGRTKRKVGEAIEHVGNVIKK